MIFYSWTMNERARFTSSKNLKLMILIGRYFMSKKAAVLGIWLEKAQLLRSLRKRLLKASSRRVYSPLRPIQTKMKTSITRPLKGEISSTKNHSAVRKLVNLKLTLLMLGWIRMILSSLRLFESHRYLTKSGWMLQQRILITDRITSMPLMTSSLSKTKRSETSHIK